MFSASENSLGKKNASTSICVLKGYTEHLVSTSNEWLFTILIVFLFGTFLPDFLRIKISKPVIVEIDLEVKGKRLVDSIKQKNGKNLFQRAELLFFVTKNLDFDLQEPLHRLLWSRTKKHDSRPGHLTIRKTVFSSTHPDTRCRSKHSANYPAAQLTGHFHTHFRWLIY